MRILSDIFLTIFNKIIFLYKEQKAFQKQQLKENY
jgi:hypothetical protein